ncbi:MAG TPA: YihY/virulence factor BrkB family protein [Flavitalea sp.]|nr:YihY/virulence factor BrkB family protein [Flavitalea sp.]
MKKYIGYFKLIKHTFVNFLDDNVLKLAASLSYFTIFSMGPVLLIMISLAGQVLGREAVTGELFRQLDGLIGAESAKQVQEIIQNIQANDQGVIGTIIGIILLIIGATGVFTEMQDSINFIWSVKAKPKKGWLKLIFNRLISFSLVIGLGFILMVSLVISTLLEIINKQLTHYLADYTVYLTYAVNIVVVLTIISCLFAVIFKVLPDAHINWKDAFIGAAFTSVLFLLGKFGIGIYLASSNIGATYGAAASLVIILLWVYYSSVILYFGAEFTKTYAMENGGGITPNDTAVFIVKQETKEIPHSNVDTPKKGAAEPKIDYAKK